MTDRTCNLTLVQAIVTVTANDALHQHRAKHLISSMTHAHTAADVDGSRQRDHRLAAEWPCYILLDFA